MTSKARQTVDIYLKELQRSPQIPESLKEAEEAFIKDAKHYEKWLDSNQLYQALLEMGVPTDVLDRAGIEDTSLKTLEQNFIENSNDYLKSLNATKSDLLKLGVPLEVANKLDLDSN